MIQQKLKLYGSELKAAGFRVYITPTNGSVTLGVVGFPRDIEKVAEILIKAMLDEDQVDDPKILSTEKVFKLAKDRLRHRWEKIITENEVIAMQLVECCTFLDAQMSIDFLGYLEDTTLLDLQCFIHLFKNSTFSTVKLRGNLPIKTFDNMANLLERMPFAPIWDSSRALHSTKFLPLNPELYTAGETCIR